MIHCVGNSHINTFSGESFLRYKDVSNNYFIGHWIGPVIAYNFFEHHLQSSLNCLWGIKKEDYVTLVVGEVDCRIHLPKHADLQQRKDEDVVRECILRFMRSYDGIKNLGFKVIVIGTHPTTLSGHNDDPDNPVWGDVERRNKICVIWNSLLKEESFKRDIPFVSIYDHLVDENNLTKMDYFLDYCHLNSSKVFPFIIQELRKAKII
jgi:hypothetical protein